MTFEIQELVRICGGRFVNADACRWDPVDLTVNTWRDVKFDGWDESWSTGAANQRAVVFFFSKKFLPEFRRARPRVIVTSDAFVDFLQEEVRNASVEVFSPWRDAAIVVSGDPYVAMAHLSQEWDRRQNAPDSLSVRENFRVHPTAIVDSTAKVAEDSEIGPYVVIGPGVVIEAGVKIHERVSLGRGVRVGAQSELFPGVTIYRDCQLGSRVRIHSGSIIGSDGFGYAPLRSQGVFVRHEKIVHLGRVVIGNDVEIGSNTCIDRGTLGDTSIGAGAKIDNQVQIGHNVQIGKNAIICGTTGISGSAEIGELAYLGGAVGISNGVVVGAGAMVAGMSLVTRDVLPGQTVAGHPQRPLSEHLKIQAILNRMLKGRGKA